MRAVTPIEVEGIRYMAPPTAQEMDCRAQLELLRNQLTDVMAKLNSCSGKELEAAQIERVSLDRSITEVWQNFFFCWIFGRSIQGRSLT